MECCTVREESDDCLTRKYANIMEGDREVVGSVGELGECPGQVQRGGGVWKWYRVSICSVGSLRIINTILVSCETEKFVFWRIGR